jgi:hypothetical protein
MEASLFLYGDTTHEVPESITSASTTTTSTTATTTATTTAVTTTAKVTEKASTTAVQSTTATTTTANSTQSATTTDDTVEYTTWMVSDKDGVNLRQTYGVKAQKLSAIPYNATIAVSEIVQADGYTWGKVNYNGFTGWCALDFCTQLYDAQVKGDINGDGSFLITDVCMLKSYIYNGLQLTDEQLKGADFNGDGVVNVADYQSALRSILLD